jgi:hypothetical protein
MQRSVRKLWVQLSYCLDVILRHLFFFEVIKLIGRNHGWPETCRFLGIASESSFKLTRVEIVNKALGSELFGKRNLRFSLWVNKDFDYFPASHLESGNVEAPCFCHNVHIVVLEHANH